MTEHNSIWQHPAVFFTTRMFILLGMMLVFGMMAYSVALFTAGPLFGLNLVENPDLLNQFDQPNVVQALKYVQGIASIGLFVFPAWYFCKAIHRQPATYLKLNRKVYLPETGLALLLVITISPFINWLSYLNGQIQLPASMADLESTFKSAEETAAQLTKAFLNVSTPLGLLANILVVGVIAAIAEEFLFRGALQNFLQQVTGNKHVAVLFAALVFSAVHGQFYGSIPRFVLGAVLGYAYLFTGNLWVSILMHFLNNTLAVLVSYKPWAGGLPPALQEDYVVEEWYINAGSALLTLGLLVFLYYLAQRRTVKYGE